MQKEIHPELKETTITCACGKEYHTKSTGEDIRVEVCSNCHPVYTGKKRRSAKGGRVERFNAKYGFDEDAEEAETQATENEETETEDDEQNQETETAAETAEE